MKRTRTKQVEGRRRVGARGLQGSSASSRRRLLRGRLLRVWLAKDQLSSGIDPGRAAVLMFFGRKPVLLAGYWHQPGNRLGRWPLDRNVVRLRKGCLYEATLEFGLADAWWHSSDSFGFHPSSAGLQRRLSPAVGPDASPVSSVAARRQVRPVEGMGGGKAGNPGHEPGGKRVRGRRVSRSGTGIFNAKAQRRKGDTRGIRLLTSAATRLKEKKFP